MWLLVFFPLQRWGMTVRLKAKPYTQWHRHWWQTVVTGFEPRSLQYKHYDSAVGSKERMQRKGKMHKKGVWAGQPLGDPRGGKVWDQKPGWSREGSRKHLHIHPWRYVWWRADFQYSPSGTLSAATHLRFLVFYDRLQYFLKSLLLYMCLQVTLSV